MDTGNPNNFFSSTNSFSYLDNDINWDLTNHLMANTINSSSCLATNSNLDYQSLMGYCNNDQISTHQTSHLLDAKLFRNSNNEQITTSVNKDHVPHQVDSSVAVVVSPNGHECISGSLNKRKAENFAESSSSLYSSSAILNDPVKKNNNKGRGKRSKTSDKEEGKHREVVHVRARRGQATDSHSIAERVRRGKINERLRCLQDIVPGCCKTMGMAVMLDEIINYVQSLQNQVEFLSMKLTAASQFHDFNSECEHVDKKQKIKAWNSEEAQDIEMVTSKGGYDQAFLSNYFYQSAAWPF